MSNSSINIGSQKICGNNLGIGSGVYVCNNPFNTLNFKSIDVAGGLSLNSTGDTIIISGSSGGAGEVNTASNVGGGAYGLFSTKVGADLRFRSLTSAGNVSLINSGNLIVISGQSATASAAGLVNEIQFNGGGGTGATGNTLAGNAAFAFSASTESLNLGNRGGGNASGVRSFVQGYDNSAIGNYSFAQGQSNIALGLGSHAQGKDTCSNGIGSHSEGCNTCAIGDHSHAEGYRSCAIGVNSHAQGYCTKADGYGAHSEGRYTCADNDATHAGGFGYDSSYFVIASGNGSFNHSYNTSSQTTGHGALADRSAILGGYDHNIEIGNTGATIIGGDTIKLTGTTYVNTTAVDNLAIFSTPVIDNSNTNALVWNSSNKKLELNTTLGGGGGGIAPEYGYIAYVSLSGNNGTAIVGDPTKPFLGISNAHTALSALSLTSINRALVYVLGGNHAFNVGSWANYVDLYITPHTVIEPFGGNMITSGNEFKIFGGGTIRTVNTNDAINLTSGAEVLIDVGEFKLSGITTAVQLTDAKITLKANKVSVDLATNGCDFFDAINASDVYVEIGEFIDNVNSSTTSMIRLRNSSTGVIRVGRGISIGTTFIQTYDTAEVRLYGDYEFNSATVGFDSRDTSKLRFDGRSIGTSFAGISSSSGAGTAEIYIAPNSQIIGTGNSLWATNPTTNFYVYGTMYTNAIVNANVTVSLGTVTVNAAVTF